MARTVDTQVLDRFKTSLPSQAAASGIVGGNNQEQNARWKSVTALTALGPLSKSLRTARTDLDKITNTIEEIQPVLDAAKSFADILSVLESAITDPLATFGKEVIQELQNFTDNAKSTGVYVLDMFEYSYIGDKYLVGRPPGSAISFTNDFLNSDNLLKPSVKDAARLKDPAELSKDPVLRKADNRVADDRQSKKFSDKSGIVEKIFFGFRPITYDQYIKAIADAFLDQYDVPDNKTVKEVAISQNVKFDVNVGNVDLSQGIANAYSSAKSFKPGAPRFGVGSDARVYVLAVTSGSLIPFIQAAANISKIISPEGPLRSAFNDEDGEWKNWVSDLTDLERKYGNGILYGLDGNNRDRAEVAAAFMDQFAGNTVKARQTGGGAAPDFYGVSVASLFPGLFGELDKVWSFLNAFFGDRPSSFSELIQDAIDLVQKEIDALKKIVDSIDSAVDSLDAFLNTGFQMLEIHSNDGVTDIHDKLVSSEGFAGTSKNTPMFIGGYVFAFGTIDTSHPVSFDIDSYYANRKTEWDEAKAQFREVKTDGTHALDKMLKSAR